MNFLIIFVIFGLLFAPITIMFAVCGVDTKHKIVGALVCVGFWIVMSSGLYFDSKGKAETWNGGYCECGGHWELCGVAKTRNGTETKYYVCPNCYTEITQ